MTSQCQPQPCSAHFATRTRTPSSSFSTNPADNKNFLPPRIAATRVWYALLSVLMVRNLGSSFCRGISNGHQAIGLRKDNSHNSYRGGIL